MHNDYYVNKTRPAVIGQRDEAQVSSIADEAVPGFLDNIRTLTKTLRMHGTLTCASVYAGRMGTGLISTHHLL